LITSSVFVLKKVAGLPETSPKISEAERFEIRKSSMSSVRKRAYPLRDAVGVVFWGVGMA
jgi:hypothetical protein